MSMLLFILATGSSSAQGFLDIWTAVGPIVGAFVGGAITWIVQRSAFRYQQKKAKEEASYQERKIAYLAFLRAMRTRNSVMEEVLELIHERGSAEDESGDDVELDEFDEAFDELYPRFGAVTSDLFDAITDVMIVG